MTSTKAVLLSLGLGFTTLGVYIVPSHAGVGDSDKERQERWVEIQKTIFGDKSAKTDDAAVMLDAPERALDASLVPMTITLKDPKAVKGLYLVIDDNPSPIAAHFAFGPDADPKAIKLRVRVNTYTDVHAVAEMKDGSLVATTKYVKASGGCSAPMGMTDEEAMRGMGDMRLKIVGDVAPDKPVDATLMVRHPNFNGMQMNQVTREYTPARYIQTIGVSYDDTKVFTLDTDISLAPNPVITFDFLPKAAKGTMKVDVKDSQNGQWSKSFSVPNVTN